MVGGRLQCLGSAQQLKSRFGSGYQLETTAALPSETVLTVATNALLDSAGLPHGTEILTGEQQVTFHQLQPLKVYILQFEWHIETQCMPLC
jgi:hypothetical protein